MSADIASTNIITANVSKTVFEPGEKVGFWYTQTLKFSPIFPTTVNTTNSIVNSSGATVYTFPYKVYTATPPYPTTPTTFPLSWDQNLTNGTAAPEGQYTLVTAAISGKAVSYNYAPVSFYIITSTAKYAPDAPVTFSLNNTSTTPFTVTGDYISILDWEGNKVYTYPATSSFIFKPNIPTILTWDQKYTDGTTAPWSSYTVSISGSVGSLIKSTPKIANIYGTYPSDTGDESGVEGDAITYKGLSLNIPE